MNLDQNRFYWCDFLFKVEQTIFMFDSNLLKTPFGQMMQTLYIFASESSKELRNTIFMLSFCIVFQNLPILQKKNPKTCLFRNFQTMNLFGICLMHFG